MTHRTIQQLGRATVYDRDGVKLGRVKEVYVNNKTGEPDYAEISHGLFGMRSTVVPLRGHSLEGKTLTLAFSKDLLKDAPEISKREHLPKKRSEHDAICEYYGLTDTADVHTYGDSPLYSGDEFSRGHTTRGFGDSPEHGGSTDRQRAESDHELGLDQTPEDRGMRGTSTHGMSDEPREYKKNFLADHHDKKGEGEGHHRTAS